jgi:hypothetical protein
MRSRIITRRDHARADDAAESAVLERHTHLVVTDDRTSVRRIALSAISNLASARNCTHESRQFSVACILHFHRARGDQ